MKKRLHPISQSVRSLGTRLPKLLTFVITFCSVLLGGRLSSHKQGGCLLHPCSVPVQPFFFLLSPGFIEFFVYACAVCGVVTLCFIRQGLMSSHNVAKDPPASSPYLQGSQMHPPCLPVLSPCCSPCLKVPSLSSLCACVCHQGLWLTVHLICLLKHHLLGWHLASGLFLCI